MHDRSRWFRGLTVPAVVLVVLAFAGCAEEPGPGSLPDVVSSSSASADATTPTPDGSETTRDDESEGVPTTTPGADPSAALEAEITAFFEEYIDTVNESWTSAEALARRREMFADSCADCLAGYEFAERAHAEDLVLEAGDIAVLDVTLTSIGGDNVVFMTVEDSPAGTLTTVGGEVVQIFDEYVGVQTAYQASRVDGSKWIIVRSDPL